VSFVQPAGLCACVDMCIYGYLCALEHLCICCTNYIFVILFQVLTEDLDVRVKKCSALLMSAIIWCKVKHGRCAK
jgi:hypothetical protein